MDRLTIGGFSPTITRPVASPIAASAPRFAASRLMMYNSIASCHVKDAEFNERPDIKVDDLIHQMVEEGKHVFLAGGESTGKSMLVTETLRRLAARGIPSYPRDGVPIQITVTDDDFAEMKKLLAANTDKPAVVMAIEEFTSAMSIDDNLMKRLTELHQEFPNFRVMATQDQQSLHENIYDDKTMVSEAERDGFRQFFPAPVNVTKLDTLLKDILSTAEKAGFYVTPKNIQKLEAYFEKLAETKRMTMRQYILPICSRLLALETAGKRTDEAPSLKVKTREELTRRILAYGFPEVFKNK